MIGLKNNTVRQSASLPTIQRRLVSVISLLVVALGMIASSDPTTQTAIFVRAITEPVYSAATRIHRPSDSTTEEDSSSLSAAAQLASFRAMHNAILNNKDSGAFLGALDQSGGSTPRALQAYGMSPEEGNYEIGTESMFDAVHSMRTRIMTSPCFKGDRILGAIIFEDTMDRTVSGLPTCEYLWETKGIVPFLKIDKGLRTLEAKDVVDQGRGIVEIVEGEASVRLLTPIPDLEALLKRAKSLGVYGTKARSLILNPRNPDHIDALVKQQFLLARRVLRAGLIPIIEPEVEITQNASDKKACEEILCRALVRELDALAEDESSHHDDDARTLLDEPGHRVMIKISLPETPNQYRDCVDHPCCLRVVALSGGYDQTEANARLSRNTGVVASFSRALAEGLSHGMTGHEFETRLSESLSRIYEASSSSSSP